MKNLIVFISVLFYSFCHTQEIDGNISYSFINSNQWNKAIQTYNFSRPFLDEKQPLLNHGVNAAFSYLFKSDKKIKQGINLSYSYFRSNAENENLNNRLNLHMVNIGYLLRYENQNKWKGFYTDLIISATSNALFRYVNSKPYTVDGDKAKGLGVGGDIAIKAGYQLQKTKRFHISPFAKIGYSPYVYSPNFESVSNQTKGLSSKNWTGILNAQVGISFHLKKANKKS